MELRYDGLTIRVGMEVQEVIEFGLEQRLNEHAVLRIAFNCKDDVGDAIVKNASEEITIEIHDGKKYVFCGFLSDVRYQGYLGTNRIDAVFYGYSKIIDREKLRCAVTAESITYGGLVDKVLEGYGKVSCTKTLEDETIPGFLLQYDETDWEFIKRLAGKQGSVLTANNTVNYPAFFYGLPDSKTKEMENIDGIKVSSLDYEAYGKKYAENPYGTFLLDSYCHTIKSENIYYLGQAVKYEKVDYRIKEILTIGKSHIVEHYYTLVTESGCPASTGYNLDYSGLHLEASVDEVSGSTIRVGFEIPEISGDSERFFPYAVESSAWYCMPEIGSKVHVYLPECDETKAYATHSLRNTESGGANASATSDPSVKSFTHPGGAAMKLDGSGVHLTSDIDGNATADLLSDGTLKLKAKKIMIQSAGKITIGKGDTSAQNVNISAGDDLTLSVNENAAYAYLKDCLFLSGSTVDNDASARDSVEIPAEILNRNVGIEAKIAEANAAAKEVEKQKVQEAKSKVGMGVFAMAVGAIAIAAVCVCTCGAGLVVVAAVAGTVAITCGAAMAAEGMSDYQKAVSSGDFSQSYNFMRDGVLGGNQTLYDILTYGSVLVCGIVIAIATGGAATEVLKQVAIEMAKDVGMNLVMDYIDDGQINNGWESYFKSACMAGCTAGLTMGATKYIDGLKDTGKFSCKEIGRMRIAADCAIDYLTEFATTGDISITKTFLKNYVMNKLFVCDPVDAASGSLHIPATDMRLPDIEEDFCIARNYESVNRRVGLLGLGVTTSLESHLRDRGDHCDILCADGHIESFYKTENAWVNDKAGTKRMELTEADDAYLMHDKTTQYIYCYAKDGGRLLYVEDRHGNRSKYSYENGVLSEVSTFAGTIVRVTIADGKLRKIEDPMERTVVYEYDGDHLISINQNDRGITRYKYGESGFITEITDQNNKKYTINTFDGRGRVIHQDYPDGTSCQLDYNDEEKSVTIFYPETGSRQKNYYDGRSLVTRIEYQDGTNEQFQYDDRQNKIFYSDRNGNARRWEYNDFGQVVKEISPAGLVTIHIYDEEGFLTETTDSCGLKETYVYDEKHNLVQKETTSSIDTEAVKCVEKFEYDRFGRLLWKEDGNSNRTKYEYLDKNAIALEGKDFRPAWEIKPEGEEYHYSYDLLGRKIQIETKLGKESYSYNSLHKMIHMVNGEGNERHDEYNNLGCLNRHFNDRQWKKAGMLSGYTYEYDYLDRLISVKDPLGRKKYYVRNGLGSIVFESFLTFDDNILSSGKKGIKRSVDENSFDEKTYFPDGSVIQSKYDGEHNILSHDNPGYYYKYDKENRITEIAREDGTVERQLSYDLKGNIIKEMDAEGHAVYYSYDYAGRRKAVWECVDRNGLFRVTRYRYDAVGNLILEQKGKEAVARGNYPISYQTIHRDYDKNNRLIKVWDDDGACIAYTYDLRNNCTSSRKRISDDTVQVLEYYYDKAGRIIEKNEYDLVNNKKQLEAHTHYSYDGAGNLTYVELPESGSIRMVYDEADRLVQRLEQDSRSGLLRSMTYIYGSSCPLVWEKLYDKSYDSIKRINQYLINASDSRAYDYSEMADFLGEEKPEIIRYYSGKTAKQVYNKYVSVYENADIWDKDKIKSLHEKSADQFFERRFKYDFRGNLLDYTDMLGNQNHYVYNEIGRLIERILPDQSRIVFEYDEYGNTLSRENGLGQKDFCLTYDKAGRVLCEEDAMGNRIKYHYTETGMQDEVIGGDGNLSRRIEYNIWDEPQLIEDGNGNKTKYQLDDWGKVLCVKYADGGQEKYSYDYAGNIVTAEDAMGSVTHFRYNGNNRVLSIRKPDGTEKHFTYDRQGRKNYEKNAIGNELLYVYNMDNQVISISGKAKTSGIAEIQSVYSFDERGILTDALEGGIHYRYETDAEGKLLKKKSGGKTLYEASYDACGRINSLGEANYQYDKAGRLIKVVGGDISAEYEYDAAGRKNRIRYGNGIETTFSYDSRNQLTGIQTLTRERKELFVAKYNYDGNGNRLRKTESAFHMQNIDRPINEEISYEYDQCDRLIRESSSIGQETMYAYDLAGNRIQKLQGEIKTTYAYNSRNQMTESKDVNGKITYEYNSAGNLALEKHFDAKEDLFETIQYGYDVYNRNTGILKERIREKTVYTQKNVYDSEAFRCRKIESRKDDSGEKTNIVDFEYYRGMLIGERKSNENDTALSQDSTKSYLLCEGQVGQIGEGGEYYFVTDEQGSVRYILGRDGEVVNYRKYDAFGVTIENEGEATTKLGFNTQLEDDLAGLYYLRSRYYKPKTGRFTQEDIIYEDGLNLYVYCSNNPVIYYDPFGYAGEDLDNATLQFIYSKVRAYQGNANISIIPPAYRANLDSIVNMNYRGLFRRGTNAAGWERNSKKYFRQFLKNHPEVFSDANKALIRRGRSPIVDDQYLSFYPQYADYKDDKLIHHHIGGGSQAAAYPEGMHEGFGGIHNYELEAGVRDNDPMTDIARTFDDDDDETTGKKQLCDKK